VTTTVATELSLADASGLLPSRLSTYFNPITRSLSSFVSHTKGMVGSDLCITANVDCLLAGIEST
jgi:hypothetical protein